MHEAAASCKDIVRAPVTTWEPCAVTLAGYNAVRYGMKVQLVTLYRVTHLQRYEVTLRGNVTSVFPPLSVRLVIDLITSLQYSVNVRAGRKVLLKSVCVVCVCIYTYI